MPGVSSFFSSLTLTMLFKQLFLVFKPTTPVSIHTYRVFFIFLLLYTLLFLFTRTLSFRDPGSVFLDPSTAYDLSYSAVRLEQAATYVDTSVNTIGPKLPGASRQPELCLGIATVPRKGVRYFKNTVGTVLDGLSETERANIHLILFIAHSDPSQHPAYTEPWLHKLADQVLLYNASDVDIDHVRALETDEAKVSGREKALFDYTYLLKACEAVNPSYIIMLEDDVVALDGWYHRTCEALDSAEKQTREMGVSKWLYLRLFYTEEFLGWNSEDWPIYLFYSTLAVCFVACVLLGFRRSQPHIRRHLPNETIILLSSICTPLLIGLFFAAGRVTMLPIPDGVHQMPRFGCCSQAFVFPQSRIPDLVGLYTSKHIGYVDMITEEYANANNEVRWAVTPSVVQHVGRRSSKGADKSALIPVKPKAKDELTDVEKLWNFRFELNDAEALRVEHDIVKARDMFS